MAQLSIQDAYLNSGISGQSLMLSVRHHCRSSNSNNAGLALKPDIFASRAWPLNRTEAEKTAMPLFVLNASAFFIVGRSFAPRRVRFISLCTSDKRMSTSLVLCNIAATRFSSCPRKRARCSCNQPAGSLRDHSALPASPASEGAFHLIQVSVMISHQVKIRCEVEFIISK